MVGWIVPPFLWNKMLLGLRPRKLESRILEESDSRDQVNLGASNRHAAELTPKLPTLVRHLTDSQSRPPPTMLLGRPLFGRWKRPSTKRLANRWPV